MFVYLLGMSVRQCFSSKNLDFKVIFGYLKSFETFAYNFHSNSQIISINSSQKPLSQAMLLRDFNQ